MSNWHTQQIDELFEAILTLESVEECYAFFEDACTIKEIIEIAQRLKVAKLLDAGTSYVTVSKEVGVSTATISRVSKCLEYGNGGYKMVMERVNEEDKS
jgi:TrpR-related protein YerC/YecD